MKKQEQLDIQMIEEALQEFIPPKGNPESAVAEAIEYSLMSGGKRIRPRLVLEFARLLGGDMQLALNFACAVEMIHTYSLIHDDLPCMDDDNMRRGRPSCHIKYGEDIALLAGDALQMLAFEAITKDLNAENALRCAKAAECLAKASGAVGMVGGQVIDLQSEDTDISEHLLTRLIEKKTAALISCACAMGCIAANADEVQIKAAKEYGRCLGFAFQIKDDILDIVSTSEVLGKPVGSDFENKKATFISLWGMDMSEKTVTDLSNRAAAALDDFSGDISSLEELAINLAKREF